ncbi:MAG: hypothetical protein WBQ23_00130, partial [Bacteroidota bacterium]
NPEFFLLGAGLFLEHNSEFVVIYYHTRYLIPDILQTEYFNSLIRRIIRNPAEFCSEHYSYDHIKFFITFSLLSQRTDSSGIRENLPAF